MDEVCLLRKCLYGLRQSGREWNFTLDKLLKSKGMARSKADPCVYISKKKLIVGVYVDDLLIIAEDETNFKRRFGEKFDASYLGEARPILSIRLKEERDGRLTLDQTAYAEDILETFGKGDAKTASSPLDPGCKYQRGNGNSPARGPPKEEFMHEPQVLLVDNQGVIALAKDQVTSDRRKHIDLKYHFLREKVEEERLQLRYVQSLSNSADLFTKPLNGKMTLKHCESSGVKNVDEVTVH
ncbi:hypothetical protein MTO96_022429 [Rhipicephalus appendiculatus]